MGLPSHRARNKSINCCIPLVTPPLGLNAIFDKLEEQRNMHKVSSILNMSRETAV